MIRVSAQKRLRVGEFVAIAHAEASPMPDINMPAGIPGGPDWQLRALISRHHYGNEVVRDAQRLLQQFYNDLSARVAAGTDLTSWQRDQLKPLLAWSRSRLEELVPRVRSGVYKSLNDQGDVEGAALHDQANALRARMGLPSRAQIIQTARFPEVVRNADIGGVGFGEWWQRDATNALIRIKRTVQSGLLQGMNPREVARLVLSTDPKARTLFTTQAHGVRMAVRTAMTAVSTEAANLEHREMRDVIEKIRVEAVLDARTSQVCMAVDDLEFAIDDPKCPQPPLHPNCRTALVAIPDLSALGLSSEALGKRVSYDVWFRKQPNNVQDDVFGAARAKRFREGNESLAQIIATDTRATPLREFARRMRPEFATDKAA